MTTVPWPAASSTFNFHLPHHPQAVVHHPHAHAQFRSQAAQALLICSKWSPRVHLAILDEHRALLDFAHSLLSHRDKEQKRLIVAQVDVDGVVVDEVAHVVDDWLAIIQLDALKDMGVVPAEEASMTFPFAYLRGRLRALYHAGGAARRVPNSENLRELAAVRAGYLCSLFEAKWSEIERAEQDELLKKRQRLLVEHPTLDAEVRCHARTSDGPANRSIHRVQMNVARHHN